MIPFDDPAADFGGLRGGAQGGDAALARFARNNVKFRTSVAGYAIVNIALKTPGEVPWRLLLPTRWTPSPTSPSATASTTCG